MRSAVSVSCTESKPSIRLLGIVIPANAGIPVPASVGRGIPACAGMTDRQRRPRDARVRRFVT